MTIFGSSLLSPAHGWCGARATIQNVSVPPPSEKIRSVQQAGKKKKGCGENEFLPACSAPKARLWSAKFPKVKFWCLGRDSNPHPFRDTILSRARIPIPPPRQIILGRASIKKLSSVAARGAFAPVPTCCRNPPRQINQQPTTDDLQQTSARG